MSDILAYNLLNFRYTGSFTKIWGDTGGAKAADTRRNFHHWEGGCRVSVGVVCTCLSMYLCVCVCVCVWGGGGGGGGRYFIFYMSIYNYASVTSMQVHIWWEG